MGGSSSKFGKYVLGSGNTACIIDNESDCQMACESIRADCSVRKVIGFDCEWAPDSTRRQRNPVELLQVATPSGCVFLFRLNQLHRVPPCLCAILEGVDIVKVGVSPNTDASRLYEFHGVTVRTTLDLRFLYNANKGLAILARDVLKMKLNKELLYYRWDQKPLPEDQCNYAAMDAWAGLELFFQWALNYPVTDGNFPRVNAKKSWESIDNEIFKFYNQGFVKVDVYLPSYESQLSRAKHPISAEMRQ